MEFESYVPPSPEELKYVSREEKLERMCEYLAHGGEDCWYDNEARVVGNHVVAAILDPGKDNERAMLEVYPAKDIAAWFNRAARMFHESSDQDEPPTWVDCLEWTRPEKVTE